MLEPRPEQWQNEGNCKYCRRREYCTKQCSANKRLCKLLVQNAIKQSRIAQALESMKPPEVNDG